MKDAEEGLGLRWGPHLTGPPGRPCQQDDGHKLKCHLRSPRRPLGRTENATRRPEALSLSHGPVADGSDSAAVPGASRVVATLTLNAGVSHTHGNRSSDTVTDTLKTRARPRQSRGSHPASEAWLFRRTPPRGAKRGVAWRRERCGEGGTGGRALRSKTENGVRLSRGKTPRVAATWPTWPTWTSPDPSLPGFCENGAYEKAPQRLFCRAETDAARALTSAGAVRGYI